MRRWLLLLILFLPVPALAQVGVWPEPVLDQNGKPVANASVAVCNNIPTFVFPCGGTTQVTLFSSFSGGAVPGNIIFTDQFGRAPVYAAAGNYYMQVVKAGFVPTVTPITIGVSTSGANILPTNNVFTGTNNFTFPVTFTSTAAVTNAGIFDNSAMHDYISSIINGCNPQSEYDVVQGNINPLTNASDSCIAVPVGATNAQPNAVAAFLTNASSRPAVAVYGQARITALNAHVWGGNLIAADAPGTFSTNQMIGLEIDIDNQHAASVGQGLLFQGTVQAANTGIEGIVFGKPATGFWNKGLHFQNLSVRTGIAFDTGATASPSGSNAGISFNPVAAGASQVSQGITFVATDGASVQQVSTFNMRPDGNMQIAGTVPSTGLVAPNVNAGGIGPTANNWGFVDGVTPLHLTTGQVADASENYPTNDGLRSRVIYSPPELITTHPFPPNFAPEWRIVPGSVNDTICDHTHIYCVLLAVPTLIGSQGTIFGVGPVGKGGNMSSGSLIMNDPTLFPPPMGIPSSPGTMTCTAGATTYDFAIRLVANVNTHAGGTPRGEGFGAYAKYHLTACAVSGNTFAMTGGVLPSGTIANSLTPTEYEVGYSATGANGPYFAQTAANLGCTPGNLGLATGVAYSCTIAGGTFSIAQANLSTTTVAFASDQKTGNPIDGSNPLLFAGTPGVSVSFNEQLRDIAVACQPTGHGVNNPNVLLLNFNGQEGAGASNGQTALYGDCGGYTGISGAMIYSASQTPNSSYSHMQISGGPTSGTVPFYGIIMDSQINGTGGASGGPREVMDVTCALRDGSGNTPPETCFLVQGSRARVNFTDDHAEMNGAQDNWHITQGARASFAGIEGSNTAGIVVHCTSTAQGCAGFNILAQGTAGASVDRCQASATAWQDDRVGGKTLKGCIDGFVGTDGFLRDLQLSPMTFTQLTGFITCAAATEGYEASVTDDNTALAFNAIITGGGTNHVHAYCNGTNWVMQ